MARYALKRIAQGGIAVLGVSIIVFVATRLSGDVALLLTPDNATDAQIQAVRERLGLDEPLPLQYLHFLGNALTGDFGTSIGFNRPALHLVLERLPATLLLAASAFAFALVIGVALGVLAASQRRRPLDKGISSLALVGQAMPNFWVAIMLILIFSVHLGWFPTAGSGGLSHLVLPTVALGWFVMAAIMRITRASMVEVLDSEYLKMARLKGNPEWRVYCKHALRNALIPVVTLAGIYLGALLGGTVIVETVFGWPGLGSLIMSAVEARDYPLVQAGVFLTAAFYVLVNLAVDLLYGVIDPRIRYQ